MSRFLQKPKFVTPINLLNNHVHKLNGKLCKTKLKMHKLCKIYNFH